MCPSTPLPPPPPKQGCRDAPAHLRARVVASRTNTPRALPVLPASRQQYVSLQPVPPAPCPMLLRLRRETNRRAEAAGGAFPLAGNLLSMLDNDDDRNQAADHAASRAGASGNSDMFKSILGSLVSQKDQVAKEDIDEDGPFSPFFFPTVCILSSFTPSEPVPARTKRIRRWKLTLRGVFLQTPSRSTRNTS